MTTTLTNEISPGILSLPLLTEAECQEVLELAIQDAGWKDATVRTTEDQVLKDETIRNARVRSFAEGSRIWDIVHQNYVDKIQPLLQVKWNRDLEKHSAVDIIRYLPGGFYKVHRDAGLQFKDRLITTVCYLNDNFEAGGTSFPTRSLTVTPTRGEAIVFPSNYLHKGNTVSSGEKFIAVCWSLAD